MPDFTTHYIFSDQVYATLAPERQSVIDADPVAYNWGAQGPDVLFFHNALTGGSKLPAYGHLIHDENTQALFAHLGLLAQKAAGTVIAPMMMSYLFGFVCHYALDRCVHPYVEYTVVQQQKSSDLNPSVLHAQVECDIDCDLYQHLYGRPVTEFDVYSHYPLATATRCSLALFYKEILHNVYQVQVETRELEASFPSMINLTARLYDTSSFLIRPASLAADIASGSRRKFSSHVKKARSGWDALNLRKRGWHPPEEPMEASNATVPELMLEAGHLATQMIDVLWDVVEGKNSPQDLARLADKPFGV